MVLNVRHRSGFIVVAGLVCLLLNYFWQYQDCCHVLYNGIASFNQMKKRFTSSGITSVTLKIETISITSKSLEEQHGTRKVERDTENRRKQTNLMIISQGRSGSSFVGQIFNQNPQVFFFYEPLLTVERVEGIDTFIGINTSEYNNLAMRLLREVFYCNWTNSAYLQYLSRPGHFRMSSRVLKSPPLCKNQGESTQSEKVQCTSLEASLLNQVCRNYTVKVVKMLEHRIPGRRIHNLESFLKSKDYDNKILYLVRDPRAFILSMWQSGWIAHKQGKNLIPYQPNSEKFRWYAKRICSQMEQNIKFVKNPPMWSKDRVNMLRYEDLIMNTKNTTKKLFELVNIPMNSSVENWVYNHMHSSNTTRRVVGLEDKYSLERNATWIMKKWRTEASLQMINLIEKQCKNVMDSIGYIPINGSSTVLYDLENPLVKLR